jgi:serine/threonine-protein kinase
VARGGTATLWLARPVEGPGAVALEVLTPPEEGGAATQFGQRFRREAETLARLDHPNIVALHDHGVTDHGSFYLATGFVDAKRFSDVLEQGPMEVRRALDLVGQAPHAP